jgi:PAS domain S-box-containing protein
MWLNFRALYGGLREKFLAAAVLVGVMSTGTLAFDRTVQSGIALVFTALVSLLINHMLAAASGARDRSAERERAAASAGAGFAASTTRQEAMDVTLGAAFSMNEQVGASLIATVAGGRLHIIAVAGDVDGEAAGGVTDLDELPPAARAALTPGGYALVTEDGAAKLTGALRLRPYPVVVVAPLTVNGNTFGVLVLALAGRPKDDLSAPVKTLADEAALTMDQLLSQSRLSVVVEHSPDALMLAGGNGTIRFVNPAAATLLGESRDALAGRDMWSLLHPDDLALILAAGTQRTTPVTYHPCRLRGRDTETWTGVEAIVDYVQEHDGSRSIVFNARDISQRVSLELELRHAQKLESVGRLAAGIAHEINTPIQFVGDNARFLETAFADLNRLHAAYRALGDAAESLAPCADAIKNVDDLAREIDIDFLIDEVPIALAQTLEGIQRVAGIVRAMKAFGHPGTDEKGFADLNEAIANTLIVANNEIKYVADVEPDLGDLPLVRCHLGDINQVVLNLIVNAAHAIGAADRGRGLIRVSTRLEQDQAIIEVADNGTGVPANIADKLFDQFFTTKDVGTGTGQGLALVRSLVVDRHGGTIDFTSEPGAGTTFTVRLPVDDADRPAAAPELVEAH